MPKLYKQKFNRGDKVKVDDDLGSCMSHFPGQGGEAIVFGSYHDEYGGGAREKKSYSLNIKGIGYSSWYYEHQLTLVKAAPFVSVKFNGK